MSLTIAIPRGALFGEALDLLDELGVDTSEIRSNDRKLVFPEIGVITMRPSDIPSYVEHGAADVGITGRDVLAEQSDRDVYELLDLGFGACRMIVAVHEDGGRVVGILRRTDLAQRELLLSVGRQLGRAAALRADEVAHPLARLLHVVAVRGVRAHARDRDELSELAAPGLVHEARSYAGSALLRRGEPPRRRD